MTRLSHRCHASTSCVDKFTNEISIIISSAIRQYPPLSLRRLQLLIDTNRLDPGRPVDLAALCATQVYSIDPANRHFGVHLTDEVGSDKEVFIGMGLV